MAICDLCDAQSNGYRAGWRTDNLGTWVCPRCRPPVDKIDDRLFMVKGHVLGRSPNRDKTLLAQAVDFRREFG